uniref:ribosomal protein L29 n=1 Tax=Galdieria phlegrea TaxID=1389228 RepID=UPI0023D86FFE|nr:ribosomal protein L29 [Galdieria phlegrea]UNJ16224.1 ribosomal protein L29 [Galdieria sp.]WDA99724.1 ribosomal protein L29 [Galdieria sulphuraria]WDA99916.1 ribosomal protein L29 [Galdieria phlegrea]
MSFPKIETIRNLSEEELDKEIISIRQKIFELSLKKATKQSIKPHLFKHYKHRLAQLMTIQTEIKTRKHN